MRDRLAQIVTLAVAATALLPTAAAAAPTHVVQPGEPPRPLTQRHRVSADRVPSRGAAWGSALLAAARRHLGVRYRWGGISPAGFDCSGFIAYTLRAVGITVPRTVRALWVSGVPVPRDRLQVGDVVFFTTTRPGPSHAGIYIGNNQFVHASSGFGRVAVTSMDYRYYKPRYLGARRF